MKNILLYILLTLFFPLSAEAQYLNPFSMQMYLMSVCRAGDYYYDFNYYAPYAGTIMRSPDMKQWKH